MPNTYVALDKITVTTATPSITFTGISGAYTDLVLVVSARSTYAAAEVAGFIRLGNGSIDTGSNYSRTRLLGTGSAASSARASNLTATPWDAIPGSTSASGNFCTTIISIQNYSNTTTYKTFLIRANEPNNYVEAEVGLWRGMSAINQVQIYGDGGGDLAVGSTFSLYGIANADQGAAKATGGIITEDSQYWYHTFGASGAFIPKQSLTCDVLVVAGGGAGGGGGGAGGGAGGFRTSTGLSFSAANYSALVGAGGAGVYSATGNNGSDSVLSSITSTGGGGASGVFATAPNVGNNGGSGGGGNYNRTVGLGNTPSTSPSQGNNGGGSTTVNNLGTGGGGGAGAVGGTGTTTLCGVGGAGTASSLSGSSVTYAGGGGGGGSFGATPAAGGAGGGGAGAVTGVATSGTANTGGGGGGADTGGNGGSGIIVIRYLKA